MREERFETGKAPHVVVSECGGALAVGSWQGTAVLAQGSDFSGEVTAVTQLTLTSAADLTLTVPEKASLTVKGCNGPLTIKHVDGIIGLGAVGGAVTLNDVGSVKIKVVGGDFHGKNINGPLALDYASGRVTLRNVADVTLRKTVGAVDIRFANGAVQIVDTRDNVTLHTISGEVEIDRAWGKEVTLSNLGGVNDVSGVRGSLRLTGGLVNGEHRFEAEGDILVAWPVDAPITLVAEAALIDNQLPLSGAAETKLANGRFRLAGHIERGKPFVSLKTTARIGLKPLRPGMTDLSAADFDFTPPPPTLDEVVETAVTDAIPTATPGQIAAAKAQQKAEKSLEKAKESITAAQTRLTQPAQPKAAKPKSEPETESKKKKATKPEKETKSGTAVTPSQTQILKLLKDGQITIEQANLLLDNLRDA